jgi:hypothetical protein
MGVTLSKRHPSGRPVAFEVPAELGNGLHNLFGRRFGTDELGFEQAEYMELDGIDDRGSVSVAKVTSQVAHDQKVPTDDELCRERGQQGLRSPVLEFRVTGTGLDGLEVLLDDPAGAVPVDDLPAGVARIDGLVGYEQPSDGLLVFRWGHFANFDDMDGDPVGSMVGRNLVRSSELNGAWYGPQRT